MPRMDIKMIKVIYKCFSCSVLPFSLNLRHLQVSTSWVGSVENLPRIACFIVPENLGEINETSWKGILWIKDRVVVSVNVVGGNRTGPVTNDTAFYNKGLLGVATWVVTCNWQSWQQLSLKFTVKWLWYTCNGLERRVLKGKRLCMCGCNGPVCTQSTPEIGVKWTPQENTCYHYHFLIPNCHTAILKWEFGIVLRDKQKLNFEWEAKRYMRAGGATYDQWLDKHQSWSWLGQGMEGKAAMGGYSRAGVNDSHLNATCLSYWGKNNEWLGEDAMPMSDLSTDWWDG